MNFPAEGADGALQDSLSGNDVEPAAGVEGTYGDHQGIHGAEFPADHGLQVHNHSSTADSSIHAGLGSCAVAGLAFDDHRIAVGGGMAGAVAGQQFANRGLDSGVDTEDGVDAVHTALGADSLGAFGDFLTGLEDKADGAAELVFDGICNLHGAQQHGGVGIMATGVHDAVVDALELVVGFSWMLKASMSTRRATILSELDLRL